MSNQFINPQVVTDTHKSCSKCKELKPYTSFHKDKKNPKGKGYSFYCKECANANTRKHHYLNKGSDEYENKRKNSQIKRAYGIDLIEYTNKLKGQGCKCAICKVDLPLSGWFTHLDHDHSSGKLRDFLCTNCNRGLGHFQDNKEILMAAIEYLKLHSSEGTNKT